MKYQALKHLKTKSKLLGMFDTIVEAREAIRLSDPQATRQGDSYIGGFPFYHDTTTQDARPYTIQGSVAVGDRHVVCSISDADNTLLTD